MVLGDELIFTYYIWSRSNLVDWKCPENLKSVLPGQLVLSKYKMKV